MVRKDVSSLKGTKFITKKRDEEVSQIRLALQTYNKGIFIIDVTLFCNAVVVSECYGMHFNTELV